MSELFYTWVILVKLSFYGTEGHHTGAKEGGQLFTRPKALPTNIKKNIQHCPKHLGTHPSSPAYLDGVLSPWPGIFLPGQGNKDSFWWDATRLQDWGTTLSTLEKIRLGWGQNVWASFKTNPDVFLYSYGPFSFLPAWFWPGQMAPCPPHILWKPWHLHPPSEPWSNA